MRLSMVFFAEIPFACLEVGRSPGMKQKSNPLLPSQNVFLRVWVWDSALGPKKDLLGYLSR